MSRKYKIRDHESLYFVTVTTVFWVDVLAREEYREIIINSLKFCQERKGLEIYAWCIMTNHVHLIVGTSDKPIPEIMRDFKAFTSRNIKEEIQHHPKESRKKWMLRIFEWAGNKNPNNHNWQLWQQHYHPIELTSNNMMDQKLDYIHLNPVKAGFVDQPREWRYSSARDYEGEKGLLDILLIQ